MNTSDQTVQVIATAAPPRSLYQRTRQLLHGRMAQIAFAALIALALSLLILYLLPAIHRFWQHSLAQLLAGLALDDARLVSASLPGRFWRFFAATAIDLPLQAPNLGLLAAHLGASALLYMLAGRLRAPFRAPVRLLALFHALSVLGSLALPGGAAYNVEAHTRNLGLFTQGLLVLLPTVMAVTHSIVERSNERRIIACVLIALWLIATLPVKLLAHALIIQFAGGIAMPTLFLVFGPALDILAVTALYAWVVTWRHGAQ